MSKVAQNGRGQGTKNRIAAIGNQEPRIVPSRVETITPADAKKMMDRCEELLTINPDRQGNRKFNPPYAAELAIAIQSEEWQVNGETIKIAADGFVEDGQHRLGAVVIANKPISSHVVRGLPVGCFDTIDCGRKRTGGDVLGRHGEKHANALAAGLNALWRYQSGAVRKTGRTSRLRNSQMTEFLHRNPGMRESAAAAVYASAFLPTGVGAACHFLFSKKDAALAEKFFEQLVLGEELKRTNPVFVLREKMRENRGVGKKYPQLDIFAFTIKAWNSLRAGESLKFLRWNGYSDNPEAFPKVQ